MGRSPTSGPSACSRIKRLEWAVFALEVGLWAAQTLIWALERAFPIAAFWLVLLGMLPTHQAAEESLSGHLICCKSLCTSSSRHAMPASSPSEWYPLRSSPHS
jgi:hypothetical protein